jgi:membrane-associated phospholipid phosphatase
MNLNAWSDRDQSGEAFGDSCGTASAYAIVAWFNTLTERIVDRRHLGLIIAGACFLPRLAAAQSDSADKTFFVKKDLVVAGAFVGVSAGVSVFDKRIEHFFRDTTMSQVRHGKKLANNFTHVNETTLTVGGLGVYVIGRLVGSKTLADIAFHTAESVAAASLTSQVIRGPLGRVRPIDEAPEGSDQYRFNAFKGFTHFENRAFPSIHSSSGFAAASALVAETHERAPGATWFVAVPAYALALTPGLSRMYLGQHWASDVVSGAILGTFYGWRIVGYSHSHPTTFVDRIFLGTVQHLQVGANDNGTTLGWSAGF